MSMYEHRFTTVSSWIFYNFHQICDLIQISSMWQGPGVQQIGECYFGECYFPDVLFSDGSFLKPAGSIAIPSCCQHGLCIADHFPGTMLHLCWCLTCLLDVLMKYEVYIDIYIFPYTQNWHMYLIPFFMKYNDMPVKIINIMTADVLVTQVTRASTGMILTSLSRISQY